MGRTTARRRHGFTLIELLVVIAIIALLMALLLPAIQRVREAANKVKCANNLKQIGIAFHQFHDDYGRFPSGGDDWWYGVSYSGSIPYTVERQTVGWMYQILPYIERDDVYKIVSDDSWNQAGPLSRVPIPLYFCPSRRSPARSPDNRAMNDYAAAIPGWKRFPGDVDPFWWGDTYDHEGVVGRLQSNNFSWVPSHGPKLTFASIIDGTSNTMVIGEKWIRPDRYLGNDWMDDQGWLCGWDPDIIRMTAFKLKRDFVWQSPLHDNLYGHGEWNQGFGFGGAHPGGMNALCGDGSVRNVGWGIDETLFWYIGNRKDGTSRDADTDSWGR